MNNTSDMLTSAFFGTYMLVSLVLAIAAIVGLWKTFQKAGQPGWAALIPIYNFYIMLKIAGRPSWWLLLLLVPLLNIIISLLVALDIAKAFNRSSAFGAILLWLFSSIGYIILGFSKDVYADPTNSVGGSPLATAEPVIYQ